MSIQIRPDMHVQRCSGLDLPVIDHLASAIKHLHWAWGPCGGRWLEEISPRYRREKQALLASFASQSIVARTMKFNIQNQSINRSIDRIFTVVPNVGKRIARNARNSFHVNNVFVLSSANFTEGFFAVFSWSAMTIAVRVLKGIALSQSFSQSIN